MRTTSFSKFAYRVLFAVESWSYLLKSDCVKCCTAPPLTDNVGPNRDRTQLAPGKFFDVQLLPSGLFRKPRNSSDNILRNRVTDRKYFDTRSRVRRRRMIGQEVGAIPLVAYKIYDSKSIKVSSFKK